MSKSPNALPPSASSRLFDEHLTDETPATGAEGHAHHPVVPATRRAGQQQVGGIDAGNRQHDQRQADERGRPRRSARIGRSASGSTRTNSSFRPRSRRLASPGASPAPCACACWNRGGGLPAARRACGERRCAARLDRTAVRIAEHQSDSAKVTHSCTSARVCAPTNPSGAIPTMGRSSPLTARVWLSTAGSPERCRCQ